MNHQFHKLPSLKPRKTIQTNTNQQPQELYAAAYRLYIQTYRRPSSIVINLIQPILWLVLFGALFQNAPIQLFTNNNIQYQQFLHPGIIIFTAFSNALNAGLPIIFDREFGFLNRILISPIINTKSLIYSCIIHTWTITNVQLITIIIFNSCHMNTTIKINQLLVVIAISTLIITNIASLSICSAFMLPGHIEFIAITTLLINLPTLFASTALAPLSFMPYWLQIIACINPLTYAVEIIRQSAIDGLHSLNTEIISTVWFHIQVKDSILILIIINIISLKLIDMIIKYKYD